MSFRNIRSQTPDEDEGFTGEPADFFCLLCESHMNSQQMWDSHVSGKRHQKNLKKQPGEAPSKVKKVRRDDMKSCLLSALREVDEPIVGLDNVDETHKQDPTVMATFQCHSCNGCYVESNIIEHLRTIKHMLNYLREVDPRWYKDLDSLKLSRNSMEPLILEKATEYFEDHGPGRIVVHMEKNKFESSLPPVRHRRPHLDKPSTSSSGGMSSSIGADLSSSAEVASAQIFDNKKIEDIDYQRDVEMIPMGMALELCNKITSKPGFKVAATEETSAITLNIINMLDSIILENQLTKLSTDNLRSLYNDIMTEREKREAFERAEEVAMEASKRAAETGMEASKRAAETAMEASKCATVAATGVLKCATVAATGVLKCATD